MGVIKAVKEFIAERGFTVMVFGISALAAGVLLYALLISSRHAFTVYPKAAAGLAIFGFATYIVGRVSWAMQRGRSKRSVMESIAARRDADDEDARSAASSAPAERKSEGGQ